MEVRLRGFRAINDNYHGVTLLVPFFLCLSSFAGVVDFMVFELEVCAISPNTLTYLAELGLQ